MSVPRLPVGVELFLPEGQAWARGSGFSGSTVLLPHYPGGSDLGANTLTEVPGASIWRNQPLRDGAAGAVPRVRPRGHCNGGRAAGHPGTRVELGIPSPPVTLTHSRGGGGGWGWGGGKLSSPQGKAPGSSVGPGSRTWKGFEGSEQSGAGSLRLCPARLSSHLLRVSAYPGTPAT